MNVVRVVRVVRVFVFIHGTNNKHKY